MPSDAEIEQVFQWYDPSGEKQIMSKDLGTVLRMLGTCPTDTQLEENTKGGGKIGIDQVKSMIKMMAEPNKTGVADALSAFDKDETGTIEMNELRHFLTNLGEKMSDDEMNDMIHCLQEFAEADGVKLSEPIKIEWLSSKIAA